MKENRTDIQKEIESQYLLCPDCHIRLHRVEYYDISITGTVTLLNVYFDCPKCSEIYSGYQYDLIDNLITNFKLIK